MPLDDFFAMGILHETRKDQNIARTDVAVQELVIFVHMMMCYMKAMSM